MSSIPRWVERYLRVPFKSRGRSMHGADCFGLVRLVLFEQANVLTKDYGFTISAADDVKISDAIRAAEKDREQWRPLSIRRAAAMDVVPMVGREPIKRQSGRSDVEEAHVGIMVSEKFVLHTEFESGAVCVSITHPDVRSRLSPQEAPLVWRHVDLWR